MAPFSTVIILTQLLLVLVCLLPQGAQGQISSLGTTAARSDKPTRDTSLPADENLAAASARLEQRLNEARLAMAKAQTLFDNADPEQIGATRQELIENLRLHHRHVQVLGQNLGALHSLEQTRLAAQDLEAKIADWKGFDAPPPYSLDMVDDLREQIHAQKLAVSRNTVNKKMVVQEIEENRARLREAEKKLRRQQEVLEKPAKAEELLRRPWLYDLARLEKDVAEYSLIAAQDRLKGLEEDLELQQKKMAFLERQLHIASADSNFSQEDLNRKLRDIDQKLNAQEKEYQAAVREDARHQKDLQQARARLEQARLARDPQEADGALLRRLQEEVEVSNAWAETSTKILEIHDLWKSALNGEKLIWLERFRLHQSSDENALQSAAQQFHTVNQKLADYRLLLETSYNLARSLADNEQQRILRDNLPEDERAWAEQKRQAHRVRADFIARSQTSLNDLIRLAGRFEEQISDLRRRITLRERLGAYREDMRALLQALWNFEIFSVEDTILVGGQKVTELRPVTVSKVVRALLILVIGIWLTLRVQNRVRDGLARLFKITQGDAATITRLFMAVSILCLAALAMTTVKIPLTIFAFFGGALAIGVGFGAQALISNFISGIILMFERPIRVGDRVEVEGMAGRITAIGLRATQVRRFDGIDILVPNSEFLQKNVVNWTLSDQLMRRAIKVGIAYGSPTREVAKIMAKSLDDHGKVLKNPEPVVLFEDFADSALVFAAYYWVEITEKLDARTVDSDLRHMLDKRFREAGITIAFPQLDVHIEQARPFSLRLQAEEPQKATMAAKNQEKNEKSTTDSGESPAKTEA